MLHTHHHRSHAQSTIEDLYPELYAPTLDKELVPSLGIALAGVLGLKKVAVLYLNTVWGRASKELQQEPLIVAEQDNSKNGSHSPSESRY